MGSPFLLVVALAAGPGVDAVLAVFTGGEVRESDVTREESYLRPDERRFRERLGITPRASWRDWIKRAALRRIATARRSQEPWGRDAARRELARRTARDWWLARWAEDCYGLPLRAPSESELRASLAPPQLPERLRLSHIFLRARNDAERREAERRLLAWREQARDLESFRDLARRHSDSESASRGGKLGVMRPGWLPREAEEALARLDVGRISPPLALRGGVHVFYVEERLPAGPGPIEPRLAQARAAALQAARERCRAERLAAAPPSADPDEDRLYRLALEGDHVPERARRHLDDLEADVWLRGWLEEEARGRVTPPTEAELRARFDEKPARTQPRFAVRTLTVELPASRDPLASWEALAEAAASLRAGGLSWEEASEEIEGSVLEAVPLSAAVDLANRLGPRALQGIKDLPAGAVAGPFRDVSAARIVGVLEAQPSRPLTFEERRETLQAALLRERQREALEEVTRQALSAAAFRLTADGERRLLELPDPPSAQADR